jgi:hypothetical protein
VRWRRDDRQPPDEHRDADAESWLSEFRPVRPDALTTADADAAGRPGARPVTGAGTQAIPRDPVDQHARGGYEDQSGDGWEPWGPSAVDVSYQSSDRGAAQPAARSAPPRADLERDVGPWAAVRPPRQPAPRHNGGPVDRSRRPAADDADTDPLGQPVLDSERPPGRPPMPDRRPDSAIAPRADGRGHPDVPPDRGGRPQRPDGVGRGYQDVPPDRGGRPQRPNGVGRGQEDLSPDRAGRWQGPDGAGGGAADRAGRPRRPDGVGRGYENVSPHRAGRWQGPDGAGGGAADRGGRPQRPDGVGRGQEALSPDRGGRSQRPDGVGRGQEDLSPDRGGRPQRPDGVGVGQEDLSPDRAGRPQRPDGLGRGSERPGPQSGPDPFRRGPERGDYRSRNGYRPDGPSPSQGRVDARRRALSDDPPPRQAPPPGEGMPSAQGMPPGQGPRHGRDLRPDWAPRPEPHASSTRPHASGWAEDGALSAQPGSDAPGGPVPGVPPGAPLERTGPPPGSADRTDHSEPVDADTRGGGFRPATQPPSPSALVASESPEPPPSGRPTLGAKLSLADLARVREALALLSDEPAAAAGPSAAFPDRPVPSSGTSGQQVADGTAVGDDDDQTDTCPLPVMLPGASTAPRPEAAQAPRGPFEPARPSQPSSVAEPEPAADEPGPAESAEDLPPAAAAKLDQIKDLLLTAEALGEQNLDRHFEQVSQRQRELIREFFNEAGPARDALD